jgi:hypothetical protein
VQSAYVASMTDAASKAKLLTAEDPAGVDMLVLSTVNAPYRRSIGAATLAECLAKAELGDWEVHIANFFTSVRPKLVLEFAAFHLISKANLARASYSMKSATGLRNPDLEIALGSLAPVAQ